MTAKEFVINKINEIIEKFPDTKVRYEYDDFTSSHIVEVLPASIHVENDEYITFALDLFFEFNRLFPEETLVIIDDESLTEIENCEYEVKGKQYFHDNMYLDNSWIDMDLGALGTPIKHIFPLTSTIDFNISSSTIYNDGQLEPTAA